MKYVSLDAQFSSCRNYRYSLRRTWLSGRGRVLFIGLNPSTADHQKDDPTIRKCVSYAKSWGFNSMEMVNLFAFRATYPADLKAATEPIGHLNDKWIKTAQERNDKIIACWGCLTKFGERAADVLRYLTDPYCLKLNQNLDPAHPLYLKANLKPLPLIIPTDEKVQREYS